MAVYSVNRRRAILLLVLTSVMLITIDLRGNAVVDGLRVGFSKVLSPFERAAKTVATPIRNLWHGATDYQDIERENKRLKDQLARQRGDQLSNAAAYSLALELQALNRLPVLSDIPKVTARVVGNAPTNYSQTVEIDHGSNTGIATGMPVVNFAGLIGKITNPPYSDRAVVMLFTDQNYAIECKVSKRVEPTPVGVATLDTTASGIPRSELITTTSSSTTTIAPIFGGITPTQTSAPSTTVPFSAAPDTTVAFSATETTSNTTSTTSTVPTTTTVFVPPKPVEIERGLCRGRGRDKLPAVEFISDNPSFADIGLGDIVTTAGGSSSLAPADLNIGTVINVVRRAGSAGPLLEIELAANLGQLNVVQVVIYRPPSEVPNG